MDGQYEEQPTVEQNSRFSAKSKDGQTIEFETSIRLFVKPPLDDSWAIEYPEIREPYEHEHDVEGYHRKREEYPRKEYSREESPREVYPREEECPTEVYPREECPTEVYPREECPREEDIATHIERTPPREPPKHVIPKDDKLYVEQKDCTVIPPDDSSTVEFIPDPCEALDNFQNSIQGFFSIFSFNKCPTTPIPAREPQEHDYYVDRFDRNREECTPTLWEEEKPAQTDRTPTREPPKRVIAMDENPIEEKKIVKEKDRKSKPTGICSISELIPDPCEVMDNLQNSVKRFFSNLFTKIGYHMVDTRS